jgi:hypothetical protein
MEKDRDTSTTLTGRYPLTRSPDSPLGRVSLTPEVLIAYIVMAMVIIL